MNENSETVELPLTDSICRSAYLFRIGVQDRGVGQCYGTGIRDEYMICIKHKDDEEAKGIAGVDAMEGE